ncbi:hypothetical protein, partial [Pseudomonas aeruginosa]|uniref:hypothetical protein n=1 Tax=Pseudomonas aeruginosa TaxID=287 RepID=UPI003968B406
QTDQCDMQQPVAFERVIDEALHGSFLVLVAIRRREAAVGAVRGPGETGRYDRSGDYKTSS